MKIRSQNIRYGCREPECPGHVVYVENDVNDGKVWIFMNEGAGDERRIWFEGEEWAAILVAWSLLGVPKPSPDGAQVDVLSEGN